MNKIYLFFLSFTLIGLAWAMLLPAPARAESPSGRPDPGRVRALRQGNGTLAGQDLEFMVQVVFADAMNLDLWATNWIRANRIPPVTHLTVLPERGVETPSRFTVLTLPERANHQVVVLKGLWGFPHVRRWMSVPALSVYFRRLTTEEGGVRRFDLGFLGMKALRIGLDLKGLLDDLHAQGLMRTEEGPPLSEEAQRGNSFLRKALSGEKMAKAGPMG